MHLHIFVCHLYFLFSEFPNYPLIGMFVLFIQFCQVSFLQLPSPVGISMELCCLQTGPLCGARKRPNKEADHSRLVGSRFNKHSNLHSLSWAVKKNRSQYLPAKS